jgi:hypothetical protein
MVQQADSRVKTKPAAARGMNGTHTTPPENEGGNWRGDSWEPPPNEIPADALDFNPAAFGAEPDEIPPEFGGPIPANNRKPGKSQDAEEKPVIPTARTVRELVCMFPKMRKVSIHGLLRCGETLNIIAPPKTGKSWGAADLAIHKATGRSWLDTFDCEPGLVFILDNELHEETIAHRLPQVAEARGIPFDDYADKIQVVSLRGHLCDVYGLGDVLAQFPAADLDGALVVIDAFYRILSKGISENDNAAIAGVYNEIDHLAMKYGCSFVLIHHSTKGNQAGKAVTDVGAGAGSQARATDSHLILRQHAEQGHYVLDAAVRSWAPVEPLVLRWDWPLWQLATGMDASQLKTDRPTPANRLELCKAAILKAFVHYPTGATKRKIQEHTGRPTVWQQALQELLDAGDVVTCEIHNPTHKKADPGYKRVYTNGDDF